MMRASTSNFQYLLIELLSEGAALRQFRLAAGRLAQHHRAGAAEDRGLRVREDSGDVKACVAQEVRAMKVKNR